MLRAPQDRAIRDALELCNRAFRQRSTPEEQARAQIRIAIASLKHGMELRAFNLRCFPGIYRRDRAVDLRSSVGRLELAAKRRRDAVKLLSRPSITLEQKAA